MKLKPLGEKKGSGWIIATSDPEEVFLIRFYGSLIREEKLGEIGVFKYKKNAEKVMRKVKKALGKMKNGRVKKDK